MITEVTRTARKTIMYLHAPSVPAGPPATTDPVAGASLVLFASTRRQTLVRVYRAPEGAKVLPYEHFQSLSDWYDDWERCEKEYGEIPFSSFKWDNGRPPAGVTGQFACGTAEDFGVPKPWSSNLPSLHRGVSGLPCCCNPVGCASLVLVARPIPTAAPLVLSEDVVGPYCGEDTQPVYMNVRLLSVDYPELDGQVFHLPLENIFPEGAAWQGDRIIHGRLLDIAIFGHPDAGAGGAITIVIDYFFDAEGNPPLLGAVVDSPDGWTCGPPGFTFTTETFTDPGGVFTGKYITIEQYDH